jgi:uncharacterized protein (DUF1499 family)
MDFFLAISLVLTALGPVGANLGWVSPYLGFLLFAAGILLAAILFFPAMIEFFRMGFRHAPKYILLIGLSALIVVGYSVKLIVENPVNDVSTMGANTAGLTFTAKSYRVPLVENTNSNNPEFLYDKSLDPAKAMHVPLAYPDLKPLRFAEPLDFVYVKIREEVKKLPRDWKYVVANDASRTVELEKQSKVFRFVDDVIIEVKQLGDDPKKSEVHIRSKSRYGKSDLGGNRQNIEALKFYISGIAVKLQE